MRGSWIMCSNRGNIPLARHTLSSSYMSCCVETARLAAWNNAMYSLTVRCADAEVWVPLRLRSDWAIGFICWSIFSFTYMDRETEHLFGICSAALSSGGMLSTGRRNFIHVGFLISLELEMIRVIWLSEAKAVDSAEPIVEHLSLVVIYLH